MTEKELQAMYDSISEEERVKLPRRAYLGYEDELLTVLEAAHKRVKELEELETWINEELDFIEQEESYEDDEE